MASVQADLFRCPYCHGTLRLDSHELVCARCSSGVERRYPIREGVPSFILEADLPAQDRYIRRVYDFLSLTYDAGVVCMFAALGQRETQARLEILEDLTAPSSGKILEVSIGTGANVPLLRQRFPAAEIHGCDVSLGMLRRCQKRLQPDSLDAVLAHANGSALPYASDTFDAVLNVGGINSFADKGKALEEMLRVVKPGGKVVINDEGLSPEREKEFYSRVLIKSIFWFVASLERGDMDPPVDAVPKAAENVHLRHVGRGYFWNLCFSKPLRPSAVGAAGRPSPPTFA